MAECRAENTFFPQVKTPRKVHVCLHLFLYLLIVNCYARRC